VIEAAAPARRPARSQSAIRLAHDLDALSAEQIAGLQAANWALARSAALGTPAVRRRWPALADVAGPRDLARLPLMSAADLAAACPPGSDELLLAGTRAGLVLRSSGTAGRRKVLYHSWGFHEQVIALGARGLCGAVEPAPHRIANCLKPAGLNGAFTFAHDIAQALGALTFPIGNAPVDAARELIADHEIDTLVAAPRYATEVVTGGPADAIASLRHVLYIGAPLGAAARAAIAAVRPDLTARSLAYSTSETGPIGYQCPYSGEATHHLHEDAVVVEVVDEASGDPVADGAGGEVVVTPLADSGMALLRYRVGDRGRLEPAGRCLCGSFARRLTLAGRAAHSIIVDTTNVSADLLLAHLAPLGVSDPTACQLQVLWSAGSFRLRLLLAPPMPGVTEAALAASLRSSYQFRALLDSPRCSGLTVERVAPHTFAANDRGKTPLLYQRTGDA
jgi:phenylacetate-CoA ligase